MSPAVPEGPCTTCGACCSYDSAWPRFSLETDEELALIPQALVAASGSGMRCEAGRCAALTGIVGEATACTIYAVRPQVCRACEAGDESCREARSAFGLADLPAL